MPFITTILSPVKELRDTTLPRNFYTSAR